LLTNYKRIQVGSNCALRDAIRVIDSEGLRLALVVDERGLLSGVVTDGDIRRALLENITLEVPVSEIMNRHPIVGYPSQPRSELVEIMNVNDLLHIPLVDKNGMLTGLEMLNRVSDDGAPNAIPNAVFIMAGGFGKRLRPLTDDIPKPMLKVGDKPILERIILQLKSFGIKKVFISLHYKPEVISDYFGDGSEWGMDIRYVIESEPLGTGGALGLLPEFTSDMPLLVMNGDLLTNIHLGNLLEFHSNEGVVATVCVREYEYQVPYGVVETDERRLRQITEKPLHTYFVNAGVYVVSASLVREIPPNVYLDMPKLLENQVESGRSVAVFPVHEYWLDIGRHKDFEQAQIDVEGIGTSLD
jgi:dTDP-glucose pyrophosphorylase